MTQPEHDFRPRAAYSRRTLLKGSGVAAAASALFDGPRELAATAPNQKPRGAGLEPAEAIITINGKKHRVLVAVPRRSLREAAIVLCLSGDRRPSFADKDGFSIVPETLLGCGHAVVSFDLPNHGDQVDAHGEGLAGMAAAAPAGRDVFTDIQETGKAVIDWALAQDWARSRVVLAHGISRGGLAALHVMAADPRVVACAIHAPVTYLPALREFASLADNPIVKRASADALVERLADRPVFMAMGESDPRVSAEHAFAFMARLSARGGGEDPCEVYCGPGVSHGETFDWEPAYEAAAAFLLRCHAHRTRGASGKKAQA
jgi:predicted esterase